MINTSKLKEQFEIAKKKFSNLKKEEIVQIALHCAKDCLKNSIEKFDKEIKLVKDWLDGLDVLGKIEDTIDEFNTFNSINFYLSCSVLSLLKSIYQMDTSTQATNVIYYASYASNSNEKMEEYINLIRPGSIKYNVKIEFLC